MCEYLDTAITLISVYFMLVGIFAEIATLTPNPEDDKYADKLTKIGNNAWKLINILGKNYGKAKNK